MTNLWWDYLGAGYAIAVIFATFFTKIVVFRPLSDRCNLTVNCDKPGMCLPLPWVQVIAILANADDEIIHDGLDVVFSIKYGMLFLVSGLIWPIFLGILLLKAYARVSGKPVDIDTTIKF